MENTVTSSPPAPVLKLSIGSVLNRSLATLFKNPVVFFGITLLAVVLSAILQYVFLQMIVGNPTQGSVFGATVSLSIISMVLMCVVQGAIAYAVYQALTQNAASIGGSLSRGMARILPLVGASLVMGIGIGFGMVLLIIPGVILMCIWAVTIPACVVEKLGPFDSMGRSAELTKGNRWQVFALILIAALLTFVLEWLVELIVMSITGNVITSMLVSTLVSFITIAFNNVMIAIIYYDLRINKDGISLDSLANVFD